MKFLKKHKGKFIFGFVAMIILAIAFMMGDEPATQQVSEKIISPTPTAVAASEVPTETAKPTAAVNEVPTETAKPTSAPTERITQKPIATPKIKATVEPSEPPKGNIDHTCTLSVRCDTILANMSKLKPEKSGLVPSDGVIFYKANVVFYENESVYNVLVREMKKNKIHLEFVNVPMYNSAYIEGIANLYENDCGDLSGWMYKVNGSFPNYGSSKYTIKDGDIIEWVYTCDWGNDVGGGYAPKNGKKDD